MLSLAVIFFSCEEDQGPIDEFFQTEEPTFVHTIDGCDNANNPEMSCEEWVEFLANGEANILIGGGDIIQRMDYLKENNIITVYDKDGISSLHLTFNVINQDTIQRQDGFSYWVRSIIP
ncbi:hypothetical protein [Roseivirga sp.]|uniref:hypothetical protein n=1 Tax=Roseivirga sp. TaxID=1964215 RepID=UPI003B8B60BF